MLRGDRGLDFMTQRDVVCACFSAEPASDYEWCREYESRERRSKDRNLDLKLVPWPLRVRLTLATFPSTVASRAMRLNAAGNGPPVRFHRATCRKMDNSGDGQCASTEGRGDERQGRGSRIDNLLPRLILLGWSLCIVKSAAWAQSPRVGHIDEVRGIESSASCARSFRLPPPPSPITLIRRNLPISAMPPDSAVVSDRLRVQRFADVRFRIDAGRFGDGTFYLVPELGRCATAAANLQTRGLSLTANASGSYRLSSRQERVGGRLVERLLLSVENGAVVVEWGRGLLSVIALGREIRDSGTVFAVVVDSAANRALLVVRDGIVTMAGVADLQATAGRAFTFGTHGRPEPVTLSQAVINDVVYHSRVVWTQSIRPLPPPPYAPTPPPPSAWRRGRLWKVLGGAAIVGGGGYLIWQATHKSDSPGPYTGTIIINIPI